jgi:hypothetical protein
MNYKRYVINLLKKHNIIEFHPHAKDQAKSRAVSLKHVENMLKNSRITDAFPNPYPRRKQFGNVKSFIIRIPKSSKYEIEAVAYFPKNKTLIATVYKYNIKWKKWVYYK